VDSGWAEASLHNLAVTSGTLSAAKAKDLYGHFRTNKTQMKGIPGPYWQKDPAMVAKTELIWLNLTPDNVERCLNQLRTDKVGGIFLVTTVLDVDGTTILATPSLVTHTQPFSENGVLFDNVWECAVLDCFKPMLVMEDPHCPVLEAQKRFHICSKTQTWDVSDPTGFIAVVDPCWGVDMYYTYV
jgi:hypothetical protein